VSHPARIRTLALAAALLAALPAAAAAATGGASAGGAAAQDGTAGGAPAGAVAPVQRTRTGGTSARRRGVHRSGRPGARRHRVRSAGGASPRGARTPRTPPSAGAGAGAPAPGSAGPVAPATLLADGTASAPAGAPAAVAAVIAAGNRIASLPYRWGGGHRTWEDTGYDCSGSVGYALHGGGLLDATSDSSGLMTYGDPGPGAWITIYANPDHVYMVVAGLRFDTSGANPSRWQLAERTGEGFAVRHPPGL
jgi:cell wall-associated NlpC family hydrolase